MNFILKDEQGLKKESGSHYAFFNPPPPDDWLKCGLFPIRSSNQLGKVEWDKTLLKYSHSSTSNAYSFGTNTQKNNNGRWNQNWLKFKLQISAFFLFSNFRKRQIALYSPCRLVGRSVGRSVGRLTSPLIFFNIYRHNSPLLTQYHLIPHRTML